MKSLKDQCFNNFDANDA